MPSLDDLDRDEFEILARLAIGYYEHGLTQETLARQFGLSRPKVQRLLDRARVMGVVDIRISTPPWLHVDLENAVREAYGLVEVIVAPARPDPQAQREEVARSAGAWLARRLDDTSVVAVSHGRDTGEVRATSGPRRRIGARFASAMGGSPRADSPTNPNEICPPLADRCGGQADELYAPAYVESAEMRDRLLEQEAIAHTLSAAAGATSRSSGSAGPTTVARWSAAAAFAVDEIARLRDAGAVGDVLGNYVDIARQQSSTARDQRLIGLDRRSPRDRHRRRGRQRGREAARDPRRPARRCRSTS